jgi:hypothetical protein
MAQKFKETIIINRSFYMQAPQFLIITCFFLAFSSFAQNLTGQQDKQEIKDLIDKFSEGIKQQDKAKITSMFLYAEAPFVSILPLEDGQKTDQSTVDRFAELVISQQQNPSEEYANLKIDIVDTTAVAKFDYDFRLDNKILNYGHEVWTLVKTSQGWKVVSVIWSTSFSG